MSDLSSWSYAVNSLEIIVLKYNNLLFGTI